MTLRLLETEDLHLRVRWVNDPEIRKNLMFDFPLSLAKTRQWFQKSLEDPSKINFSIVDNQSAAVIGMTGLIQIDLKHRRAQFYITIGEKAFWGRRIADEVIALILEHAFLELNLNKVYLYTLRINERARKVYARNGFSLDGVLREHYYCNRGFQDLFEQSILQSEWLARRARENVTADGVKSV